jgi:hypothetical protein
MLLQGTWCNLRESDDEGLQTQLFEDWKYLIHNLVGKKMLKEMHKIPHLDSNAQSLLQFWDLWHNNMVKSIFGPRVYCYKEPKHKTSFFLNC